MESNVKKLAFKIKNAKNVLVLTGAGMDTESDIPDFRSKNGWWRNIDPKKVANIDTFYDNYDLFHEFYSERIILLDKCEPHKGHKILAEFEEKGFINSIATQNVSGLHAIAGSREVYELHGNIRSFRCNHCNKPAHLIEFLEKRDCKHCGRKALRPNVVLFGEPLPTNDWDKTLLAVDISDIVIVIGSSLEVSPVNQIPRMTRGQTVYINDDISSGMTSMFDIIIKGKAKEVLEEMLKYIDVKACLTI